MSGVGEPRAEGGSDAPPGGDRALADKLERIPESAGVYLMLDGRGKVLYVGKAASLRHRVRTYFTRGGDERALIPSLLREVRDVTWIVTRTEKEALILESTLIKRHHPRYNIDFRDDKSFVTIRIDPRESFPRLSVVRRPPADGALYFGPHSSSSGVRETLRFIRTEFGIRPCSDGFFRSHSTRPCIQYDIGRCSGPCCGLISKEDYGKKIEETILFLKGKRQELVRRLEREMSEAAEREEFERAARQRDRIAAIARTIEKQSVVDPELGDLDAVGLFREGTRAEIAVLFVREGKLVGVRSAPAPVEPSDEEVLTAFLSQVYGLGSAFPPTEILLPSAIESEGVLAEWLQEKAKHAVGVFAPRRGEKRRLVEMAIANAESSFRARLSGEEQRQNVLVSLQKTLGLARCPNVIECYDISNLQGGDAVGSLVSFRGGERDRERYRRFRIKSVSGADDFAMLREVLVRRLARAAPGTAGAGDRAEAEFPLPDLFIIDGGKGQLSSALDALDSSAAAGLDRRPDVIALAKARLRARGRGKRREWSDERVFRPGHVEPIVLPRDSPELLFLQRVRDEAHRFAIGYHRRLRSASLTTSVLDSVAGIGKIRRRTLLERFGGLAGLRAATLDEIAAVEGIGPALAAEIVRAVNEGLSREGGSAGETP